MHHNNCPFLSCINGASRIAISRWHYKQQNRLRVSIVGIFYLQFVIRKGQSLRTSDVEPVCMFSGGLIE